MKKLLSLVSFSALSSIAILISSSALATQSNLASAQQYSYIVLLSPPFLRVVINDGAPCPDIGGNPRCKD